VTGATKPLEGRVALVTGASLDAPLGVGSRQGGVESRAQLGRCRDRAADWCVEVRLRDRALGLDRIGEQPEEGHQRRAARVFMAL
jgi:hypothetical protein